MNYHRAGSAAALLVTDNVLIAGGVVPYYTTPDSAELYNPIDQTWEVTGSMNMVHEGPIPALLLNNGMVLYAGGYTSDSEIYDPASKSWSYTGAMITARTGYAAAVLNNGKVLAAGGGSTSGYLLATAEIFSLPYIFGGFLAPLNIDKPFQLRSTIPIKFQLTDASGNYVPNAIATISLQKYSSAIPDGDTIVAVSTTGADAGNTFRYDSTENHYIFNLNTKSLSVGTWQIIVTLDDETVKTTFVSLK